MKLNTGCRRCHPPPLEARPEVTGRTLWPMARLHWAVRCSATAWSRGGRPCRKWAIRGGYVCPSHGGSTPQVRAAAQRRLAAAQLERSQRRPLTLVERQLLGGKEDRRQVRREVRLLLAEVRADVGTWGS